MLEPGNAVAAIIICNKKFLLQLRDEDENIFFPNHWGLFGGEIEKGEVETEALQREINEELGITIRRFRRLMCFIFDLKPMGSKKFYRSFYEIEINNDTYNQINLSEGQKFELVSEDDLFSRRLTPYDNFALWWYLRNTS